jgi:tRNA U34 5-methylaminomethyl-2-thiouridine-forming methyltransferase MnmC
MNHPLFEVVTTTAGAVSIRNKELNEIMHNPVGPWVEANALYIVPSQLKERLSQKSEQEFVLFDVGLGAAANSLAVLHCARSASSEGPTRFLRLVSFERELELLRYTLGHAEKFAHFNGYVEIVRELLERGSWEDENIKWELRHGDFLQLLKSEVERPHLVYFDPYSPKVNQDMWTTECFKLLFEKSRVQEQEGTRLYTYSQATPIRVALLQSGFFVGQGPATGLKEETTQAATHLVDLQMPLGAKWLERWGRSHMKLPYGCPAENADEVANAIRRHPQFLVS